MKRYIFSFTIALLCAVSASAQTELPVADLVDIVFQKDGSAIDKCGHNVRKRGGCTAVWNSKYNRYCGVASTANTDYYSIKCWKNETVGDDINTKLAKKTFTIETLVKVTGSFDDTDKEVKVFSGTQGGGVGLLTCKTTTSNTRQHPWSFLVGTNSSNKNSWKWAFSGNTPSTGVFYHLVGVYSSDGAKLYVDGELVKETSFTEEYFPIANTYNTFHLFGDPKNDDNKVSGWNTLYQSESGTTGEMAIARMYGKSLTAAEVKALYNNLTSGSAEEPSEPSTPTTSTDNVTADLFDIAFRADGTATNISTNDVTVETVRKPQTQWNKERGRFTTTAVPTEGVGLTSQNNDNYHKISYLNNEDIPYAILTGRKYTLEAFIKFTKDVPTDGQVKFVSSTQGGGVCLDTDGGTFRFMLHDGSSWKNVDSEIQPETGQFYHVVGVRNGTTISIYVNGNLMKSATVADGANGVNSDATKWFAVCGDPHADGGCSNAWPCELAIARMYSTALTDAQVKDSYNAIRKFDLTVPQPDMFDIAFGNDNIAKDVKSTGTPMNVTYKDKVQFYSSDGTALEEKVKNVSSNKWSTIFNQEYGRFALHSNYNWGTGEKKDNNKPNFEFSYKGNDEFKRKMTNGHTIELLANVLVNPKTVELVTDGASGKNFYEAKWLSTCEQGGVAMMVGYDDSNNANGKQEHEYMHYIIYTDGREHHIGSDKPRNLQVELADNVELTGISNACAEIDNEVNSLTQTVKVEKKGWYRLSCDGFYTGSGTNSAKLFAKSGDRPEETKVFKVLSSADKSVLDTKKSDQKSDQGDFNKEYLLNDNTAAAEILNPATRATASDYKNWLDVYVGERKGEGEGEVESLSIGFRKESEEGQAFADNFTLQYSNLEKAPIEIYQSASKSNQGDFNKKVHKTDEQQEVTYNLRRIFYKDQWNALVLPVSLTAKQLKEAFGSDVKLSRLYGVNENRPTQLVFKLVNWTDDNETVLNAHDCYVIKPSELKYLVDNDKSIDGNDDEYKFYSEQIGVENPSLVSAWGPLFQFKGVSQENWMPNSEKPWNWIDNSYSYTIASLGYPKSCTWDRTTGNNQYKMRVTCYYERPTSVPANRYIVENGKVYYLSSEYSNLYATYWSLEDVTGTTTKAFSMAFDDDETTVIHGLEAEAKAEDNRMYNLNGQRIANDAKDGYLPKGIYITNGRKVVVR